MHLVSILIPNYNKANYLRETLDSVLAQTYSHWECIIVDDHSTDHSWEILEEYVSKDSRFRIYKRPSDRKPGGNAARNYAFEVSKGEYVNWLDSDDILDPNNLLKKLIELQNNPQLDFAFSDIRKFEFTTSQSEIIPYLKFTLNNIDFALESLKGPFWIQTSLPLFSRNYLEKFKTLFSENIIRGQEAEFFVRILLDTSRFKFIPESIVYWRISENSKTTIFQNRSNNIKEKEDYLSRKMTFLNFKNSNRVDYEVNAYFKDIFENKILEMKFSREYVDLVFLCIRNRSIINFLLLIKLIAFRIFFKK